MEGSGILLIYVTVFLVQHLELVPVVAVEHVLVLPKAAVVGSTAGFCGLRRLVARGIVPALSS